jgi:hypothetical protein
MAVATQASVLLGTLTGILHLFPLFPSQPNTKVVAHALFAALTVLLLFASLAAGRFLNVWIGIVAFGAAVGSLAVSLVVYRNEDPKLTPSIVALYACLQMLLLVLVVGAAGLGAFS